MRRLKKTLYDISPITWPFYIMVRRTKICTRTERERERAQLEGSQLPRSNCSDAWSSENWFHIKNNCTICIKIVYEGRCISLFSRPYNKSFFLLINEFPGHQCTQLFLQDNHNPSPFGCQENLYVHMWSSQL